MPTSVSRICVHFWRPLGLRNEYAAIITLQQGWYRRDPESATARLAGQTVSGQAGSHRNRSI